MSIPLTINGAVFEYPVDFDENWGVDATGWAQAVTNGMLQMAGGSFPLTADVNFGPNFGLLSKYFETRSSTPATTGTVRLSSADAGIAWRNFANSGNNILTTDASNNLQYNGSTISGGVNAGTQYKLGYYATTSSNISPNPNTMAATQVLVTDANGVPTTTGNGATTATEIGYVHNVTSAIQTQLNTKATDSLVVHLAGSEAITGVKTFSAGAGAITMSGSTIAMGANKITGLANGTASTDAAAFGQIFAGFQAPVQSTTTSAFSTTSSTFNDTGFSVTITPTSASHRISLKLSGNMSTSNVQNTDVELTLTRNTTNLAGTHGFAAVTCGIVSTQSLEVPVAVDFIDSPATTSAITYRVYIRNTNNSTSVSFNAKTVTCVLIAEEIV